MNPRYVQVMSVPSSLQVRVEVAAGGFIKRRPDGSVDFVSPVSSPFAYGSVLGTEAQDGDPEDALIVGCKPVVGSTVSHPVWGQVVFMDAGHEDNKWVVGPCEPSEKEWRRITRFFRLYAVAKRALYKVRSTSGETRFECVRRWDTPLG